MTDQRGRGASTEDPAPRASLFGRGAERSLVGLMSARLALTLVSFAIVLVLDGAGLGRPLSEQARRGLYWMLALGFLATALSGLSFGRIRSPRRFAAAQLAADLCVVSGLVHFSGGHESVFSFLYVAVTAYGAMLLEARSALAAATASAVAYGLVLLAEQLGYGVGFRGEPESVHAAVAAAHWAVHVGALFLVGALGSVVTTELRRTGAALDRSSDANRRLRDLNAQIVTSLNSGLLTTDCEGRVGSFNPEGERITGRAAVDVVGRPVNSVIPGAWELLTAPPGEGLEPVRRTRLAYERKGEGASFLGLAGSDLRDGSGKRRGYVLIFQDVTHVVAMETQLTQRERLAAVGEMAARIAHEIRNPLAAISGSVQLMAGDRESDGPDRERLMEIVVREADRLSGLISDFLGYARPRPLVRSEVSPFAVAADVLEMLEAAAPDDVELVLRGDEALQVWADPDQLRQVVWNLCLNGVEAMPKGGRLLVSIGRGGASAQGPHGTDRREELESSGGRTTCADRCVVVTVEDQGEGIASDQIDRLFEPFFTTKAAGSGLGLATVHRIVEAHGGRLQVESGAEGTRFRVLLQDSEGRA